MSVKSYMSVCLAPCKDPPPAMVLMGQQGPLRAVTLTSVRNIASGAQCRNRVHAVAA